MTEKDHGYKYTESLNIKVKVTIFSQFMQVKIMNS
jgi:hypothetical protein